MQRQWETLFISFVVLNPGRRQAEIIDVWNSTRTMHHQISLEGPVTIRGGSLNGKPVPGPLNLTNIGFKLYIDAEFARPVNQYADQVGVKAFERVGTTVKQGDLCASPRRDVSELKRDVTPSHEYDPGR